MNVLESIDEQVAGIVRTYAQENELAILVRTNGNDVRVIAPNAQRDVLAKMLRIAASMLEEPVSRQFN
ncbi:hypothetical protein [Dyella sp. SG609]|uniref:hypothetical protein n=1 Tax=Dyella sp. SG609 TaxID=2587018 RepID=UPI0014465538|nr:hypothetical protein [Dyella sp. SG609]NKJ22008.1 ABC-type enterochelin transport system substrate-binding protein [Dyella sp. SG609]